MFVEGRRRMETGLGAAVAETPAHAAAGAENPAAHRTSARCSWLIAPIGGATIIEAVIAVLTATVSVAHAPVCDLAAAPCDPLLPRSVPSPAKRRRSSRQDEWPWRVAMERRNVIGLVASSAPGPALFGLDAGVRPGGRHPSGRRSAAADDHDRGLGLGRDRPRHGDACRSASSRRARRRRTPSPRTARHSPARLPPSRRSACPPDAITTTALELTAVTDEPKTGTPKDGRLSGAKPDRGSCPHRLTNVGQARRDFDRQGHQLGRRPQVFEQRRRRRHATVSEPRRRRNARHEAEIYTCGARREARPHSRHPP